MIKKGYKYKIKYPKYAKTFFICSISGKGRDGQYHYYTLMSNMNDSLQDMQEGEEIEIKDISGVSKSEYNGKTQVTIFADIERLASNQPDDFDLPEGMENSLGVKEEDLPF